MLTSEYLWVLLPLLIQPVNHISDGRVAVAVCCSCEEVVNAWVCGGVVASILRQGGPQEGWNVLVKDDMLPMRDDKPARAAAAVLVLRSPSM
jgi:hypothetical protein